jgi:sigma-B regulation protein RsbU (phosphoserine phosphatase)
VNLVGGDPESGVFFSEKDKAAIVTISSLAGTAIENAFLHQESLEKAKLKANLQIARTIQQGMYPTQALEIPGYAMAWVTRSCDETGGDYFDFIAGADGCIYCAVGDVSGHGIGAALLMATGRAELRALLSVKTDCKEIVDRLNGLLAQDMDSAKFMTLVLFRLDPRTHALTHVNAGHDPPILLRADGRTMDVLGSTGIPLGMLPEWSYEVGADRVFAIGDALLLTTDGVWEAPSPSGDRYGKRRLEEVLLRHADDGAQGVVDAILEDVDRFTSGVLEDDLTIVVLKRMA